MQLIPLLSEIRARKLELARLDPHRGMPVRPPAGATPRVIAAVERRMGCPLPPSFHKFLLMHDGFPQLFQGASLLGAQPIARGTYVDVARLTIELGEDESSADAPRFSLLPFGLDPKAETIFAFDLDAPTRDGELEIVLWVNEIGARVESFPAFLELVLDMLQCEIDDLRRVTEPLSRRRGACSVGELPLVLSGRNSSAKAEPDRPSVHAA